MGKLISTLFFCMIILIGGAIGCSNGNSINPVSPTNDQDQTATPLPTTDPPPSSPSSDGPGNPIPPPEEGITVKLEAYPTFIGVAYVGYPTQFRAIAWNRDGEIIGFYGNDFDPTDSNNFIWQGLGSALSVRRF